MSLIDIKAVKAEAAAQVNKEETEKAKNALVAQMRVVANSRRILQAEQLKLDDAHFAVAELEQMLELAEALDKSAGRLTLKERFTYAQAPVDTRTEGQVDEFLSWSHNHAAAGRAGKPWFLDAVDGHSRLDRMEQALRACTLWLWLDLRFPNVYGHLDEVLALRSSLNDGIERHLKGKRPLAQQRRPRR